MTCVKLRRFVQGDASELPSLCTEYTAGPYFGRDWLRAQTGPGRNIAGAFFVLAPLSAGPENGSQGRPQVSTRGHDQ